MTPDSIFPVGVLPEVFVGIFRKVAQHRGAAVAVSALLASGFLLGAPSRVSEERRI